LNIDAIVKSPRIVMPDLIRHPGILNLLMALRLHYVPGFRRNDKKTEKVGAGFTGCPTTDFPSLDGRGLRGG
jgi:hypothetical protein